MNDVVLSLKQIVRVFQQGGKSLTVLNGLDLEVKRGEAVAFVGPSGSGKTTLLQIAGLLDTPTSGEVIIAGTRYFPPPGGGRLGGGHDRTQSDNAPSLTLPLWGREDNMRTLARRRHIGFVYQFHHLLPEFTALENVALPQMIAGSSYSDAAKKAETLLRGVALDERLTHRPAKLSGGEQQRVAIARALANDPALLLADEPTGNLDPHTASRIFNVLIQTVRQKGLAALIATHNMELAKNMDRIVRLENGVLKND